MGVVFSSKRRLSLRRRIRERDGDACWICGMPMRFRDGARQQHECDASLDHVVLRKDGGANSISNLKLAHRLCNCGRQSMAVSEILIARWRLRVWRMLARLVVR